MKLKRAVPAVAAGLALSVGAVACGGNDKTTDAKNTSTPAPKSTTASSTESQAAQAGNIKLAFSAPAADHGWLKAVTDDAKAEAKALGIQMTVEDSATSTADQADQIQTLIQQKPDALVVLPNEGGPLTQVAQQAMDAGIPVINVDRAFTNPSAQRVLIAGDNYGIGQSAAAFFAKQLNCKGNVVDIQGLAGISVTTDRTKGFEDGIKKLCGSGIKIVATQPADFTPDKGLSVMENILQANKKIDAVYTQDDDMGQGVAAAIQNAGRDKEMWMTGAGGSKQVLNEIKKGGLWRATFIYNPAMAADGVYLASLLAQHKGLPGFQEPDIPNQIIMQAATVTKDNVDQYMPIGF
jgi:ribose transport system substrate-binding protein